MRTLLTVLASVPLLVGCSQVPKPMAYSLSYQKKMQAARHWKLLASKVAAQVSVDYVSVAEGGVYVDTCTGVFGEAFTELLKTELVNHGVPLSATEQGSAVLSTEVQMVKHRAKWPHRQNRAHPGFWTGVATVVRLAENVSKDMIVPLGVALDAQAGTWVTLSSHEVLITTSLEKGGNYVMRRSDLYYVNDADAGQYAQRLPGTAKMLEVVAQ